MKGRNDINLKAPRRHFAGDYTVSYCVNCTPESDGTVLLCKWIRRRMHISSETEVPMLELSRLEERPGRIHLLKVAAPR
jgi:hypothetical protein